MKSKRSFTWIICCLIVSYFIIPPDNLSAGTQKWMRVGRYWFPVVDSGDQGEGNIGWGTLGLYYYQGFTRSEWSTKANFFATHDWTDTTGANLGVMVSGNGQWETDETNIMLPIPDANGFTMHKYRKNQPPEIWVDGFPLHDPFPRDVDEHVEANDEIPGNADVMVRSTIRSNMGLTVEQRAWAYSQQNHDDYIITEWIFTNTGNSDFDDEIEYPSQTLDSVYTLRQLRWAENQGFRDLFGSEYGGFMTDTLRIPAYGYPTRQEGSAWDNTGDTEETGLIEDPTFRGEAVLHADVSVDDESDAAWQPAMTGIQDVDLPFVVRHPQGMSPSDWALIYQTMKFGLKPYDGTPEYTEADGIWPGTHHSIRFDERGFKYAQDYEDFGWALAGIYSVGPYTLEPGDDFRIVWAEIVGSISYDKGLEVGRAWLAGNSEETVPFPGEENLPERYILFDDLAPTDNDKNKDRWIFSSLDSMHQTAYAAKWAKDNNWLIPEPPPAPSVFVNSRPEQIEIEWNYSHLGGGIPSDVAGFRVYRAVGSPDTTWTEIADVGMATNYGDKTASRGLAYYYHVAAYDDGSNTMGVKGVSEVLESGRYLNRTTFPAHLTRPAGTLKTIRVVPNPFNINARELQYVGEPDKILFVDVPGYCIIDIFTESGDLVQTIVHDDGSGDQSWGVLTEEHMISQSGQVVVSGLYLARIEETDPTSGERTGDATVVKFLIVR